MAILFLIAIAACNHDGRGGDGGLGDAVDGLTEDPLAGRVGFGCRSDGTCDPGLICIPAHGGCPIGPPGDSGGCQGPLDDQFAPVCYLGVPDDLVCTETDGAYSCHCRYTCF